LYVTGRVVTPPLVYTDKDPHCYIQIHPSLLYTDTTLTVIYRYNPPCYIQIQPSLLYTDKDPPCYIQIQPSLLYTNREGFICM
jgi:hypothetical protein